jgi:hypothetical protein
MSTKKGELRLIKFVSAKKGFKIVNVLPALVGFFFIKILGFCVVVTFFVLIVN